MNQRERRRGKRTGRAPAGLIALAAAALCATGCKATIPKLAGDGSIDLPCTPYADLLLAYTPAGGGSASGDAALGAPDGNTVVVTPNTVLTVGFIGLGGVVDGDGDDIDVHGTFADQTSVDAYASADGNSFVFTGTLDNMNSALDLKNSRMSLVLYIQLVGQEGSLAVDSFEAVRNTCAGSGG